MLEPEVKKRYGLGRNAEMVTYNPTCNLWQTVEGKTVPEEDVCILEGAPSGDPNTDRERIKLLREALAKNEKGEWILVPAKITDFLLGAGSPLEVHTFKDNKDVITYNKVADSGVWNLEGAKEIEQVVSDFVEVCGKKLKEQLTRFVMLEVLAQIQWKTYINRETFKSPSGKIPLLNGVYDSTSGKLEAHSQTNNFFYQSPVKYDPAATCPSIDQFLEQVLGDKKQVAYEMAGYAIAESNPNKWQRAFMLIGPGDNGKSTFLNLVTMFLGKQNVSQQTLQALVENRFAAAGFEWGWLDLFDLEHFTPIPYFNRHPVSRYNYSSVTLFKDCYSYSSLIQMFTHLLTDLERKRIRGFIKADGEKGSAMRGLATRSRQYLPKIEEDLALIREFLQHYEQEKAKG